MALIDKASLLMVPSTYEAGTLYNVLPSGNRAPDSTDQNSGYDQTRADFTFDRGSNAAATRVNADGLIEKYRENILVQSNNFSDSVWTKESISVTSGQSGYDGSLNASLLKGNTSNTQHRIYDATSNASINTLSVYVKASGHNYIQILSGSSASQYANFDLSDGSLGSNGSAFIPSIQSVGGGWYRISAFNRLNLNRLYIQLVSSKTSPFNEAFAMPNDTDGVLIQNAQAELGLVATDYLDSGATTAKAGVLIDLPRINYDANGENGALLLEPSRQQLLQYSEYFDNYWNKEDVTITNNAAISPEGVNNSTKLVENATNQRHRVYTYGTFTSGTNYTFSVFVKKNSIDRFLLLNAASAFGARSVLNLDTLEITNINGTSGKVENFSNGWYRFSISGQATTSSTLPIFVQLQNAATDLPYLGNGSSLYLYGAQLESNASYPSSYIPNHGESGGVTRAADSCLGAGNVDSINSVEGVLYWEGSFDSTSTTAGAVALIGSGVNRVQLYNSGASLVVLIQVNGIGAFSTSTSGTIDITSNHKYAVKWGLNNFAFWVDGVEVSTNTSGATFSDNTLNELRFSDLGTNYLYANTKQLAVFNEALSDSELETLTTL